MSDSPVRDRASPERGRTARKADRKKHRKHSKKRRRASSSSSTSSSASSSHSSSSSCSSSPRRRSKSHKAHKRKHKREKESRGKTHKKDRKKRKEHAAGDVDIVSAGCAPVAKPVASSAPPASAVKSVPSDKSSPATAEPAVAPRVMVPMSRAQYEAQQSVVREELDPETGRMRLIKGSGEVIERIVSKAQHKAINTQSTYMDGVSFMRGGLR